MRFVSALIVSTVVLALAAGTARAQSTVTIKSEPPGAEVWEGDRKLGTTPYTLGPPLGVRRLHLERAGYESKPLVVTVRALQHLQKQVTLDHLGVLVLAVTDPAAAGAAIQIDGVPSGNLGAPGETVRLDLQDGPHLVEVVQPNFEVWTHRDTYRAGGVIEQEVVLTPRYGNLAVGRTRTDDLVGVPVYLDAATEPLGATPFVARVQAGRHVLHYRYEGLDAASEEVEVRPDDTVTVPVQIPPRNSPFDEPWDSDDRVDVGAARASCQRKVAPDAGGCVVAAYAERDDGRRELLYRRGCDLGDADSCYAIGYLRARGGAKDAAGSDFAKACAGDATEACWARYAPLGALIDPRSNPGPWRSFLADPPRGKRMELALYVLSGTGLDVTRPLYLEGGADLNIDLTPRFAVVAESGLRGRVVDAHDVTGDATDFTGHVGYGISLGLRASGGGDVGWSFLIAGRGTIYIAADDAVGAMAAIGWRAHAHRFELGGLIDRVPTRYQDLPAAGGTVRVTEQAWVAGAFLKYTRVLESEKL